MVSESEAQDVMASAQTDLAGNVDGRFSPEDWNQILGRAKAQLLQSSKNSKEAWVDVILSFTRENYWGFRPNYKKPKPSRDEQNLGKRFIWYVTRSFLVTKIVILWFGARYTAGYGNIYGVVAVGAMIFMLSNYGLFLWRYGRNKEVPHPDEVKF